jgi:hypothetical protein
MTRKAGTARV